jgi:ethanolaminephosphotransferase
MLMWMGQASFFAFGNSNSLATIDIRGGYTGLDDYNEIAVPILIACTGLAGPIMFFIASLILIGKMSQ